MAEAASEPPDPRFTEYVIERVASLIAEAERTGARVAAWDEIQQILIDAQLGWYQQVEAQFCGVHYDNRSKQGVGGSEAHHHGRDVLKSGFSWERAKDAIAVEVPSRGPRRQKAIEFNEKMATLSGGLIPPILIFEVDID